MTEEYYELKIVRLEADVRRSDAVNKSLMKIIQESMMRAAKLDDELKEKIRLADPTIAKYLGLTNNTQQ